MKRILLSGILALSGFLHAEDTNQLSPTSATVNLGTAVPNPTVTGPIPATVPPGDPSHDYPFFSTYLDLAVEGYVEEEFFMEGTANRYLTPLGQTGSIILSGYPYKTRMIVRRPASAARFNGVVIVEWQNSSNGYDFDALWSAVPFRLMRSGFAWVGVSATANSVHNASFGLKTWSPTRYGSLDLRASETVLDNSLCYDVYSQAVQAIRNPSGVDPLGGLPAERLVLASGYSAPAGQLVIYHNSIHPLHNVVSAYLLWAQYSGTANWAFRTDLNTFVFQLLSETDVILNAYRLQADSSTFRGWQFAGTAHAFYPQYQQPLFVRDSVPASAGTCNATPYSLVKWHYSLAAATEHLVRWVNDGVEPPTAPPLQIESYGPPAVLARDSFGLALGGIRLPDVAVPTAVNNGMNSGTGFCLLLGSHVLFDDATLNALYRNHGAYVSLFNQAVNDSLRNGYLLEPDADAMRETAAVSRIPPR
jgi:hypothetical protein